MSPVDNKGQKWTVCVFLLITGKGTDLSEVLFLVAHPQYIAHKIQIF